MKRKLAAVYGVLFIALVLVAMPGFADPPGVAGRLAYMQGPVSLQPGGVDDWIDATLNRPLTTSDRIWADQDGRAEIAMGNVKARIGQLTSMTITNLDDANTQLELDQGSLFLHVHRIFDQENIEVDTPNLAFTVDQPGDYRFDVDPNGDTTVVSVIHGDGDASGQGPGVELSEGQSATFTNGNSLQYTLAELPEPDDFTRWNMARDDRQDHSMSARYVSPGVVGYDDLDEYGAWSTDPTYGPVWRPQVAVGWAPYRMGHWAWIDPWGYTWVDDAPWGFAPFHYGRWVYAGGGWGWAPGPPMVYRPGVVYVRPVYAPALVAFIGGGGFGVSVGIGGGVGVGWVPLGWGEPYYPSYHVSEAYVRNVNVTNTRIVNVTNVVNNYTVVNNTTVINNNVHYANATVPGAVTAVPANAMASGRPVNQVAVKVTPQQVAQAKFAVAPGVPPTKEAVLGGKAPAQQHIPPKAVLNRQVVAKTPPPPPPARFEAQQQMLAKSGGRPLEASQVKSLPKVQRPAPKAVVAKSAAPPVKATAAGHTAPAAPGKPAPAQPGRPIPANTPAPKPPARTNEAGHPNEARPGENTPAARPNEARPNEAPQPSEAARPNGAKPVPRPPASTPSKPAAQSQGAPESHPAPEGRNVPRPPQHEAAPAGKTPPPANKEKKPSKEEKKPEKPDKDKGR